MSFRERLKDYLKGYNSQYYYTDENNIEHNLDDDIEKMLDENQKLKDNWNKLKKDLELVVDYGLGDESSKWDKIYGEYAKSTLKFMQELEQGSDSND